NAFQPLVDYLADRNYDGKADNEFEIANIFDKNGDLALKQVYVELGATIFLNAFAGGDSSWELGDWIAAILGGLAGKPGGIALTPAQTSFITNLILNFDIGREIGTEIGLRIAAVARFNPKDAIADVKENVVFALNSDDISTFIGELYKRVNGSYILLTSLEVNELIASRKVNTYKKVVTGETTTYQLLGDDLYTYTGAVFYQNADGITYTEFTADALKLRKLQVYSKGYESAGNKFVEIPKAELATYTGDRFASINRNGKQTYVKIEASKVATYTEKVFKIDASFDIAYLLSHSDLVLDIFNKALTDVTEQNEASSRMLGIKLIYEGEKNGMPSSTIYIDLGQDTHIAIPGVNLTSLFAKNAAAPTGALVAAETPPTTPTDPVPTPPSTLDKVMSIISGALYGIFVDSNQLKVQIAPQFLSVLLGMILSVDIPADKFLMLNPERSYISLDWKGYDFTVAIGVDPLQVGLTLSTFNISLGDESNNKLNQFERGIYTSALSDKQTISFNIVAKIQLDIFGTNGKELKINDYISAFVADLALNLGISIEETMKLHLDLSIGANIDLNDPSKTEIILELFNPITDQILIGLYAKGSSIYVDMGFFNKEDFYVENSTLAPALIRELKKVLGGAVAGGAGDAMSADNGATTAADGANPSIPNIYKTPKYKMVAVANGDYVQNLDKYVLATLAEKNDDKITKYSAVEDEKGTIVKVVNKDKTFYFKAEANLTTDEKILVETNRLSNVIIKCSDKHLSLIITESFIVGLIGMLVGNTDVQSIFDALPELGLDLTVDLNFEKLALEVTLNSNIIRLYLGIIEPRVATEIDKRISNRISDELIFKLLSDKEKAQGAYTLGRFKYINDKKVFVEDKDGLYKNLEYVLMTEQEKTAWEAAAEKTPIYIYVGDKNDNGEYDKGDYQFVAITALADAGTGTDAKSVYKKLGDGETKDYIKMADVMTEAEIAAYKGARYTKNGDRFEVSVNGEYMEREKYRFNKFERTGKVSFDLYLSLGLNISATYILLDDNTIKPYPESERYSKRVTDGKYIQDNNGNYVRQSLNLDEILGALLNLDSIKNSVANIMLG
ncbi:MAG: hypothetical protein RSB09_02015, partial [Clostridia bacterium]